MRPATLAGLFFTAILGGVCGFFAWQWWQGHNTPDGFPDPLSDPRLVSLMPAEPPPGDASLLGTRRPDFALPDPAGRERTASEFDGQVVLVNFWATWCGPCREEMPMLVDLQDEFDDRGLIVLGVAMDDMAPVRDFAAEYGIDYPLVVGEAPVMALTQAYGNRIGAIPFTAILDREGRIRHLQAGKVTRADLAPVIEAHL